MADKPKGSEPQIHDDLNQVVARNLRELMAAHAMNHLDVALYMAARGFTKWTRNRVAQTVTLRRSLSLDELAGLCAVFEVPLSRFLDGDLYGSEAERVNIGHPMAIPLVCLRDALLKGEAWWVMADVESSEDQVRQMRGEAHNKQLAQRLGVGADEVARASERLYGTRWALKEAGYRLGDIEGLSEESMNAKAGHITRTMLTELRTFIDHERQTRALEETRQARRRSRKEPGSE